ncbi:MAG: hypothetical protein GXP30_00235 [Verrucomicrobia bacterium]|nr:hypothetical protein [Verrucomicrobiota bacterium]
MVKSPIKLLFHSLVITLPLIAASGISITASAAPDQVERRARKQTSVPGSYREMPFVETAPEPLATSEEKKRGYILFTRPITEPIHANTHPLESERLLDGLSAFATPGEWEPITLGVYPLRDLKNFRLTVSNLTDLNGNKIKSSQITIRLQTYWNIGYPRYSSRETYRRVPELLERVNVHSSPARECQRWWIQVHVPNNAKAGIYRGTVRIQDDGLGDVNHQDMTIPISLRVLGFSLQQDPEKHYSAYYRTRDRATYKDKDEAFYQKASANEFQAMREYGIDQFPTLYLIADKDATKISIQNEEEIKRLAASGMKGRVPILGGNAIARIYRATTPEGKRESHWKIDKMPPPEFYTRVTKLFRDFEKDRIARGLPPMICCPLDEVAASHKEFGVKVFQAVHAAGIPTYITKFPTAPDALDYAPYVDVWCSQPYAIPYEKIIAQKRHEYWSYPNHNAGERKNRLVMCKGGRMTYGFGFWRSGYTTLIPWHWSWTMAPDPFDYLRSLQSGCGIRIDEAGEIIPPIYWECFREGRDDARYLYTLQQAVFEREGSSDPKCQQQVQAGKALLQENWDSIQVQQRYLSDGMWPSAEFNARRWRLATMIESLHNYSPTRKGNAPSVLIGKVKIKNKTTVKSVLEEAITNGFITARDLGEGFSEWKNGTLEGKIEITKNASPNEQVGLRWKVKVDHQQGGDAAYLVGWPRIRRTFKTGTLDLSHYDFLEFMIRIDSDRDEVADDKTPFGISIRNYGEPGRLYEIRKDLGDQQRVWIPLRFSIRELIDTTALGSAPWKNIQTLQLFIAESDYNDNTSITFDIGSARLLAASKPLISRVETSQHLLLPTVNLPVAIDVIGLSSVKKGSHTVSAALIDHKGKIFSRHKQDLLQGGQLILNTTNLTPGKYSLKTQITTAAGELCSKSTQSLDAIAGPFYKK